MSLGKCGVDVEVDLQCFLMMDEDVQSESRDAYNFASLINCFENRFLTNIN